jgi:hypothetical protein
MNFEFSRHTFEKYSNVKFHENPSSGSRVVPYGRTDRRTDMAKLVVSFRSFTKAPKKRYDYFSATTKAFSVCHHMSGFNPETYTEPKVFFQRKKTAKWRAPVAKSLLPTHRRLQPRRQTR